MSRALVSLPLLLSSLALALAAPGQDRVAPLLPQTFAGWSGLPVKDAPAAPPASEMPVLQEDGLARHALASYASGSADLIVRAWEFKDATGAYSAFTFYRQPQMHPENIGSGAASAGDRFVFWTGATVVDATFAHPAKDEPGVLQALSAALPKVGGGAAVPPSLPRYLPAANLNATSVRYAIGPAAYAAMGGVVPADEVGFSEDAETITAQYGSGAAPTTLTLVMYPTPQIAEAHLKILEASAGKGAGLGALAKRSGPLLAVVRGKAGAQDEKQLLDAIRFNDYVTINHPEGYVPETVKLYRLLMGITMLTVILVGGALLLGIFLGGGRALIRLMRGKPISSVSEEEFISLHLRS